MELGNRSYTLLTGHTSV